MMCSHRKAVKGCTCGTLNPVLPKYPQGTQTTLCARLAHIVRILSPLNRRTFLPCLATLLQYDPQWKPVEMKNRF